LFNKKINEMPNFCRCFFFTEETASVVSLWGQEDKRPKHGSQNRLWSHMPEGEERQL
jgi:hypothetical protein